MAERPTAEPAAPASTPTAGTGGGRARLPPLLADGLLLIDKHAGCTSHDVVQQVRRLLRQRRIGHCGTLDPEATGLLLLTVGQATRLTRFLIRAPKVYTGTVRLGIATDTYDAAGEETSRGDASGVTNDAVGVEMRALEGTYEQKPPPYCARKVGGVRFYELARRGEEVPETTKEVTVFELVATGPLADDTVPFRLACTSGTYARTLAHDLGQRLGCGGHLSSLRRLEVGGFSLEQAATVDELSRRLTSGEGPGACWIPFDAISLPFAEAQLDTTQELRIRHGQTVLLREPVGEEGDWVKLLDRRRRFLAVGTVQERIGAQVSVIQPKIVFGGG